MTTFLGIDLGWYGKPTGLAALTLSGGQLQLRRLTRIEDAAAIVEWIESEAGGGGAVAGVDAPLVINNQTGTRPAERDLNRDFRRYHAGCHAANLGRPFAAKVLAFRRRLEAIGFVLGGPGNLRPEGRFQIEVHPHAATVSLFGLSQIVKYKRGLRQERARELRRLRKLLLSGLPSLTPALPLNLPPIPASGNLKPVEDQIDAVMCAYIAAHWWYWGPDRNTHYGTEIDGYIVVPAPRTNGLTPPLPTSQSGHRSSLR